MEAAEASTDVRVGAESREEESVCTEKERDIEGLGVMGGGAPLHLMRVLQDRLRLVQEVCVVCVCVRARARTGGRAGRRADGRAGGGRAGVQKVGVRGHVCPCADVGVCASTSVSSQA